MFLIIGLGNPGQEYQDARHNLGFMALDYFRKEKEFSNFVFIEKFNSLISEGKIEKKKIILVKPQTFMNNSGKAVKKVIKNLKLKTENLFVIHDDIDIKLGEIKIVKNRGPAGHKGVESIIKEIGTKDFLRIRMGISPQKEEEWRNKRKKIKDFVLEDFNKDEKGVLKETLKKTSNGLNIILKEGLIKAINKLNKSRNQRKGL